MVLNVPRVRLQRAMAVAQGTALATSNAPLEEAWGDALACEKAEGEHIVFEANKARMAARAAARRGAPWQS